MNALVAYVACIAGFLTLLGGVAALLFATREEVSTPRALAVVGIGAALLLWASQDISW